MYIISRKLLGIALRILFGMPYGPRCLPFERFLR